MGATQGDRDGDKNRMRTSGAGTGTPRGGTDGDRDGMGTPKVVPPRDPPERNGVTGGGGRQDPREKEGTGTGWRPSRGDRDSQKGTGMGSAGGGGTGTPTRGGRDGDRDGMETPEGERDGDREPQEGTEAPRKGQEWGPHGGEGPPPPHSSGAEDTPSRAAGAQGAARHGSPRGPKGRTW